MTRRSLAYFLVGTVIGLCAGRFAGREAAGPARVRHVCRIYDVAGYAELSLFDNIPHGFNTDYFRHRGKLPDKVGIAIVGDSYVVGWGVGEDATLASRLGAVNFGRAGYQPEDIPGLLVQWVLPRNPDVIVYMVNAGDVYPYMNSSGNPLKSDEAYEADFVTALADIRRTAGAVRLEVVFCVQTQHVSASRDMLRRLERLVPECVGNAVEAEGRDLRIDSIEQHPNAECYRLIAREVAVRLAKP